METWLWHLATRMETWVWYLATPLEGQVDAESVDSRYGVAAVVYSEGGGATSQFRCVAGVVLPWTRVRTLIGEIPRASEQLSPCPTSAEPACGNYKAHAPRVCAARRGPSTAGAAATRETKRGQRRSPAKNNKLCIKSYSNRAV